MTIRTDISQKQVAGMAPAHILGKAVLKMNSLEVQEFVRTQASENPALALDEERPCPACGDDLAGDVCTACGAQAVEDTASRGNNADDWHEDSWTVGELPDDSSLEPFAVVASPKSLSDHVREQIRTHLPAAIVEIAEFIADALDEDGYLREPLMDMAGRFGLSVPELESVLSNVQGLDPPGIAARSLQECLLIQLHQLDLGSDDRSVAETIVRDHWDGVSRMKLGKIAQRMHVSNEKVESALRFIRENLNPRPGSIFRDPWERLAPRRVPRTSPDIAIRRTEAGLVAETADPVSGRVAVEQTYADLYAEMARAKGNGFSDADRAHVKECVLNARSLIEALEFRECTLRKVAGELVRRQAEFFADGPAALKPITRKELARKIGVHESTVCRAAQDKTIRLPTGEVIALSVLFDSALPVKELVRKLAGQQLSDGEIAEKLRDAGIQIARRTVAKYRDQLRVLPLEYRMA